MAHRGPFDSGAGRTGPPDPLQALRVVPERAARSAHACRDEVEPPFPGSRERRIVETNIGQIASGRETVAVVPGRQPFHRPAIHLVPRRLGQRAPGEVERLTAYGEAPHVPPIELIRPHVGYRLAIAVPV